MTQPNTNPTDAMAPIVPIMPQTFAADGGREPDEARPDADDSSFDRPPRTDHAPADRDREAIEPLVPDLR